MKLNIKVILNNWYIIKALDSVEASDITLPIEQGLERLIFNKILDEDDIIILETFRQGFNINEIAKLTKISRQTVSSRIDDIVIKLELLLGKYE